MADPLFPATPQAFTYGGRQLYGIVTEYNGMTPYRTASHVFAKRDGGIEELMGRGQRTLEVRLKFIGADCAKQYQDFVSFVDTNRSARLDHPTAGHWQAVCKGPGYKVTWSHATNLIETPVLFVESELDAVISADTPDVATASQVCTAQQSQFQQTIGVFMGALASAQTQSVAALNSINAAVAQVTAGVTAPVALMRSAINVALGVSSSIVGALASIQAANDALVQDVTNLVTAANDLFGASTTVTTGFPDSIATLLGIVQQDAQVLEDALTAASATPAGAAYAAMDVEIMVDTCMTLRDAVAAAQPPTAQYVVPREINLLKLAQILIQKYALAYDALTYGSEILGLNRIPNPGAIPAGTVLTVPTA